ncbi:MAG: acyl-CoA synthetase [Myxococcales bacterium]|jgi:malonyl-CoA/methylmalonyl-CoA synthetase
MSSGIPLVERAHAHAERLALTDDHGEMSYAQLLDASARAATRMLDGAADLDGARVAFLTPPGIDYVVTQWGIWCAGGIAVPLCTMHPPPELQYVIADSDADLIVAHPEFDDVLAPIAAERNARLLSTSELMQTEPAPLPSVADDRGAMLIYTSGTTGKPKGALSTHAILAAQIRSVVEAWEWNERDRILHVLPLHHLHGILNLLCAALWSGAACELLPRFDPDRVWNRIAHGHDLTLFMAVPTIYARLIRAYDAASPPEQAAIREGCRRLRLMVSGSAALPVPTLERWRQISGHTLLERYGMTEIGMGLGNPLHGERRPGHVGTPFPGVEVRLVGESGAPVADGEPGRIEARGPGVFAGYWRRPEATREVFTDDGWFRTGDVAVVDDGAYRILGRESVDILKTGGFKVSALEIEEVLRTHPAIDECAVVGVADPEWGQRVAAAIVLREGASLELDDLRQWGKARLAHYKVPTLLRCETQLPRNALGKVQKPEVTKLFTTV